MLITKQALIYFAISIKISWIVMVLFYTPLLFVLCLAMNIFGLAYFFKKSILPLSIIAIFGMSLDSIWHLTGLINFEHATIFPLFLLPIWLSYSVFILYFFKRFERFKLALPVIFSILNLISFMIGIELGGSIVYSDMYYVATLTGWLLMGFMILNIKESQFKLSTKTLI
ncbi:DUF2878 family protein [Marinicellulosiphila megalodicopiae]|uniref:DUF2878 family protein n=1 Tax=Marinicellulosiphila megalodicopiae TaxID=2724896 RepID=UPI003BAEB752